MAVFWDVAPCSLVDSDWHFRAAYCLHHHCQNLKPRQELDMFGIFSVIATYQTSGSNMYMEWKKVDLLDITNTQENRREKSH
jgi:hypothetical protein